jgi:hypothetical protein
VLAESLLMSFQEYKKDVLDFEHFNSIYKEGYDERLGEPDHLSSAIGLISIAFQNLEEEISKGISKMLAVSEDIGDIITSELAFKVKLNLFASLIHKLKLTCNFNTIPNHQEEHITEFVKALSKCEELRNRVMHSTFIATAIGTQYIRQKKTSRAKKGLVLVNETIDIYHLLNIYDFIASVSMAIDEFFIGFKRR